MSLAAADEPVAPPQPKPLNSNVRLTLIYSFVLSISQSLLMQTPMAAFILLLTEDARGVPGGPSHRDNLAVGIATGIGGVVNLLCAMPAGVLADRLGRQLMLRAASCIALLGGAYFVASLAVIGPRVAPSTLYYLLLGGSALNGMFMGLHSAPLAALFGDSIASGERSRLYVWRSSLRTAGTAVGPLVSICVFLGLGDEWRASELRVVCRQGRKAERSGGLGPRSPPQLPGARPLAVVRSRGQVLLTGVGTAALPAAILWRFRDALALGAASEGLVAAAAEAAAEGAQAAEELTAAQREAAAAAPRRACCGLISGVRRPARPPPPRAPRCTLLRPRFRAPLLPLRRGCPHGTPALLGV